MLRALALIGGVLLGAGSAMAAPVEEAPVSRQEFAMQLLPVVKDWEARRALIPPIGRSIHTYVDLDPTARPAIVDLASRYNLFVGVPGLTGDRFQGGMTLNRSEAATILVQLLKFLRSGEALGTVPAFSDLGATEQQRYAGIFRLGVMEGFPDKTFRAYEPLTWGQLNLVLTKLKGLSVVSASPPASASAPAHQGFEFTLIDQTP